MLATWAKAERSEAGGIVKAFKVADNPSVSFADSSLYTREPSGRRGIAVLRRRGRMKQNRNFRSRAALRARAFPARVASGIRGKADRRPLQHEWKAYRVIAGSSKLLPYGF